MQIIRVGGVRVCVLVGLVCGKVKELILSVHRGGVDHSLAPRSGCPPHHYNSLHATSQDKDVVFSLYQSPLSPHSPPIHTQIL